MKFNLLAVSAVSLPIILSHASPIGRLMLRQTPSYSVVAVDGGSSGAAAAATTVTAPASTLPPTTKIEVTTLFSTIVLTKFPTPTTIVLTITSTAVATATTVETISEMIPDSAPTAMPAASPPISFSTITISPSYTGLITYPSPVTVTETPSSVPYDNGMWHTTYWHAAAAASSTTESVAAPSTVTPGNLVVSTYNTTNSNYTAPAPLPPMTNLTMSLNWTAPVNYTNARLRLAR